MKNKNQTARGDTKDKNDNAKTKDSKRALDRAKNPNRFHEEICQNRRCHTDAQGESHMRIQKNKTELICARSNTLCGLVSVET